MPELNHNLPPEGWDQQVQQQGGHFLQSLAWARFQHALGRQPVWAAGGGWSWVGSVWQGRGVRYLYVPYGPTLEADLAAALQSLQQAGGELAVDFVRFEPVGQVAEDQLSTRAKSFQPVQPQHTWVLDLTAEEPALRSGMSSGHRNVINTAAKRGLKIESAADPAAIERFLPMLHDTYQRSQIKAHPDSYYRQLVQALVPAAARFYFATKDGQDVAAVLVYDFGSVRYYAHAVAYQQLNRELKAAAPLVWQAILDAKAAGQQQFDFWGITPTDDPKHPWAGISTFKRAFGGQLLTRAGTWDLPVKARKYQLYRLAKRFLPI